MNTSLRVAIWASLLVSKVGFAEGEKPSKEPRVEKSAPLLSAQLFAGGLGNGVIYGAEAEINLTNGLAVGAAYVPNSVSSFTVNTIPDILADKDYGTAEVVVKRDAKMAFVRLYPFNGSFHLTVIGAEGTTRSNVVLRDNLTGNEETYLSERSQRSAGISIGNNFRFRTINFGFEWLGYMKEISGTRNAGSPDTSDNANISAAHATVEPWVNSTSLSGLTFVWIRVGMGL